MKHVPLKPAGPLYAVALSERRRWEKDHREMYARIDNMKGVLDHSPPWRDDRLMDNLKKARKWYEAANGAEIARENKLLVDKLYSISKNSYMNQQAIRRGEAVAAPGLKIQTSGSMPDMRTGGKVHEALRKRNAHTIEADNEALVGRILSVKNTIDMKAFADDFRKHKSYSALRSRLPKDMGQQAKPRLTKPAKPPAITRSASQGTRGFLLAPGDLTPMPSLPALPAPELPAPEKEAPRAARASGPSTAPAPMVFVRSLPPEGDDGQRLEPDPAEAAALNWGAED